MLSLLLSRITGSPWLILAAFIAGGAASYKVTDWRWTAKYEAEASARQEAIIEQQRLARAADLTQSVRDRAVVSIAQEKATELESNITKIRSRITGAQDVTYQAKYEAYPFTLRFVRDFNSLSVGAADNSGMPDTTASTGGTAKDSSAVADLTRKDLLTYHADQMNSCLAWKQQLESIIEWDKQTFGDKK